MARRFRAHRATWLRPGLFAGAAVGATVVIRHPYVQTLAVLVLLILALSTLPPRGQRAARCVEVYCHEVLHGIAGLFANGRWERFYVHEEGGGVCHVGAPGRRTGILVSAAGYVGVVALGASTLVGASFASSQVVTVGALVFLMAFPLPRAGDLRTGIIGAVLTLVLVLLVVFLPQGPVLGFALSLFGATLISVGFDSLCYLLHLSRETPGRSGNDADRIASATGTSAVGVTVVGMGIGLLAVFLAFVVVATFAR